MLAATDLLCASTTQLLVYARGSVSLAEQWRHRHSRRKVGKLLREQRMQSKYCQPRTRPWPVLLTSPMASRVNWRSRTTAHISVADLRTGPCTCGRSRLRIHHACSEVIRTGFMMSRGVLVVCKSLLWQTMELYECRTLPDIQSIFELTWYRNTNPFPFMLDLHFEACVACFFCFFPVRDGW